jgi:hypothetical protein
MNSLQKPCNYYEKYMKYKKKYIDYKNKLLVLSDNKKMSCNIIGGGIDAQIEFISEDKTVDTSMINTLLKSLKSQHPLHITITYTDAHDKQLKTVKYHVVENIGSGTSGTVYKIIQIKPQLPPGINNNFVIKLKILKEKEVAENKEEGEVIDSLPVEARVKAIYQGRTNNIDFAIFNYLGQNLKTTFEQDSTISAIFRLSLIQQLHVQLYNLNHANFFHNDVKMENIVVQKVGKHPSVSYVLSLIDYGLLQIGYSNIGTTQSMCIHSCARFLLGRTGNCFLELKNKLIMLIMNATSTDYVGFFNIIICLLNPSKCAWDIYSEILNPLNSYSCIDLLKILCLLCYISNSDGCDDFLSTEVCKPIVSEIEKRLNDGLINIGLFTQFIPGYVGGDIPIHIKRRILFLSYIYSKILENYSIPNRFVHETKLPKLLWDLSCCLDLQFNLEKFHTKFSTIFNEELLQTAQPQTAQPQTAQPQPSVQPVNAY